MTRHHFPRTQGFTLIELLVVISIIALLVAILLPALSSARASAQSIACHSNLRQMIIGVRSYVDMQNEWWPVAGYIYNVPFTAVIAKELGIAYVGESISLGPNYAPGLYTWSYTGTARNNGIFQCPSETGLFTNLWGGENATSYRWNTGYPSAPAYGLGMADTSAQPSGAFYAAYDRVREADIKKPTNTIVMGDGVTNNASYEYIAQNLGAPSTVSDYHQGGANFLWADGHASHLHKDEVTTAHFDRTK